ncbi:hypothetical protein MHYP_G00090400 [Metynnis hypsauchen]
MLNKEDADRQVSHSSCQEFTPSSKAASAKAHANSHNALVPPSSGTLRSHTYPSRLGDVLANESTPSPTRGLGANAGTWWGTESA